MQYKNILITGISKGLGAAIAQNLLTSDNYCVFGISRSKMPTIEKLQIQYGDRFRWLQYDLSNVEDIRNTIFKTFIGFDVPLHGFVNNAAVAYDDIVTNLNYTALHNMYQVNVFTPMVITKYAIRHFLLHNITGSIVHLSSISVHTGYKGLAMYASTKGALEAFSKNTAREWGEKQIRSNAVVAGFMETEMNASLSKEQKDRIYKRTSLKSPTDMDSVASTVDFLLSEKAMSITGQNIFVDAGTI